MNESAADSRESEPRFVATPNEAPKIGGWLILPAFALVLSPIVYVVQLYLEYSPGYFKELPRLNEEYPGFLTTFATLTAFDFLLIGFVVYVVFRFFTKHVSLPRLFILMQVLNLALSVVACVWFSAVIHELDTEGVRDILRALIGACIWIPYFLISKRVKATFIVDPSIGETETSVTGQKSS